jgi:hypothetical protein
MKDVLARDRGNFGAIYIERDVKGVTESGSLSGRDL